MNFAATGARNGAIGSALAAAALLMALSGCSDGERSREIEPRLAQASVAIDVSRTRAASEYAAAEMAIAEEKLAAARQASAAGQHKEANRLLAESLVNLELGRAKTEAGRLKAEIARLESAAEEPGRGR